MHDLLAGELAVGQHVNFLFDWFIKQQQNSSKVKNTRFRKRTKNSKLNWAKFMYMLISLIFLLSPFYLDTMST